MIAAVYARKSTDQSGVADDQKSVARQIEHARQYAQRKGWTVADEHIYVDDGISGAEFANRPAFVRLMNALKPKAPFQALVMSEESRLGREQLEVGYALKQIIQAGVRVFFYLEDRERTLDSPTDKIMLSLTAFADELEREKARQRTYDAMRRKAKAGHVCGGRVFGYDNTEIVGPDGKRDHVVRQINATEAAVIRRMFELSAAGHGTKAIAKILNADRVPAPSPQQGRPRGWAPSSVWTVLRRPLYHGQIVWNQTRKRDRWGRHHQTDRPLSDHIVVEAPELQIIPDALWRDVQAHLEGARRKYTTQTGGRTWGRPVDGTASKYLLTGLASCGVCGAGLIAHTRSHGHRRVPFYVCSGFELRGRTICANNQALPLARIDREVLDAFREDLLHPSVLDRAFAKLSARLRERPSVTAARVTVIQAEIDQLNAELARLTEALASGADFASVADAIRSRETRRTHLVAEIATLRTSTRGTADQVSAVAPELRRRLGEWRAMLAAETHHARQMLRAVLQGRIVFTPRPDASGVEFVGHGHLGQLFEGLLAPSLLASPTTGPAPYFERPIRGRVRRAA